MSDIPPGMKRAIEKMQELIDAAPKHPLYDIVIDTEAMEEVRGTGEIIIGWRGKVEWEPREYRRRMEQTIAWAKFNLTDPDIVPPPRWGSVVATNVFVFEDHPEDVFNVLRKMLDHDFLRSLQEVDFAAPRWVWSKRANFA